MICEGYDRIQRAVQRCWINEHTDWSLQPEFYWFVGCLLLWAGGEFVAWAARR